MVKINRENVNKKRDRRTVHETLRLANILRSILREASLRQLTKKTTKIEVFLGTSFDEFKKYIEFLMTTDMKWKIIDFDHARPLSFFKLTPVS